ncbi:MAG: glycosyltransferase N-terminal domain-containing protein [Desulfomonilia bacterium]|nr:glycosyltransferase N-terminal domain-containing protein [Desulfomonilia bacterium]
MAEVILFLYRLLTGIMVWPLALALRNHPNFESTLAQRLSLNLPDPPSGRPLIWVHAASVGEVKAIAALMKSIRHHHPGCFVFLTCMTSTGMTVARQDAVADMIGPFPFDTYRAMRRLLLRLHPEVILEAETEIWPNMLCAAAELDIPLVYVNARMSLGAFGRYRKISVVIKRLLREVRVLAITQEDAARFAQLGAKHVEVMGNLKLDAIATADPEGVADLRAELGIGSRPVFIAGSTREGEEEPVIEAIARARVEIRDLFSIIVPRHPDRVKLIRTLAERHGMDVVLRSSKEQPSDLLVVDTMGELFSFFGISDVAFVGGSLVDLGGQNILEPIAWGVPTIHGPFMDNFSWALEVVSGHTIVVKTGEELAGAVMDVLQGTRFNDLGQRAREALSAAGGVTDRYVRALAPYL